MTTRNAAIVAIVIGLLLALVGYEVLGFVAMVVAALILLFR